MHDAASGVVPYHAHQFDDAEQQYQTSTLGMWLFLGQEVLFFGAVFATYFYYFYMYPDAFEAASRFTRLGVHRSEVPYTSRLSCEPAISKKVRTLR